MKQENTKQVEQIRYEYTEHAPTKTEELKKLDNKVRRPAEIFSYSFGTAGALVLGTGMCLAMSVLGSGVPLMVAGIVIGLAGIAMVSVNYLIYKRILKKRRNKYAERVLTLSDEILNG